MDDLKKLEARRDFLIEYIASLKRKRGDDDDDVVITHIKPSQINHDSNKKKALNRKEEGPSRKAPKKSPRDNSKHNKLVTKLRQAGYEVNTLKKTFNDIRINHKEYEPLFWKGYQVLETGGDGDCLFYALSHGLRQYNYNETYGELRKKICDVMESFDVEDSFGNNELTEYVNVVYGESEEAVRIGRRNLRDLKAVRTYINNMRKQGVWGGEMEVLAAHLLYPNINIFVLKYNEKTGQYYVVNDFNVGSEKTICLYNSSLEGEDYHFQLLVPPPSPKDGEKKNLKNKSRRR